MAFTVPDPVFTDSAQIVNCPASMTTALSGGGSGGVGDFLAGLLVVPAAVGAGNISIKDGTGSSISVFVTGTLADLRPFFIPIGAFSQVGAWSVTCGGSVSVIARGRFT